MAMKEKFEADDKRVASLYVAENGGGGNNKETSIAQLKLGAQITLSSYAKRISRAKEDLEKAHWKAIKDSLSSADPLFQQLAQGKADYDSKKNALVVHFSMVSRSQ